MMTMAALANHLWQSTLFAAAAAVLALVLRKHAARVRYWLWFAASIKFLIPFSVLVALGSQFEWRSAAAPAPPREAPLLETFETAVAAIPAAPSKNLPHSDRTSAILVAIWAIGSAALTGRW